MWFDGDAAAVFATLIALGLFEKGAHPGATRMHRQNPSPNG